MQRRVGADPDISFERGHEAPKAPKSRAAGARIEAPRGVGFQRGVPLPMGVWSGEIFF